jgi:thiamine-monophosphate kinase
MMNEISENRLIGQLASQFLRSPIQLNRFHETDAEIIQLSDDLLLALTTDSIAEEISLGLYVDPYLIGWMTATANLSDLAAVGAKPLGILISEILPAGCDQVFLIELQRGLQEACSACGTFVLGGDANRGPKLVMTGTAAGLCSKGRCLSRIGMKPGDMVYSTGLLGIGNAYAFSLFNRGGGAFQYAATAYKPIARIEEGQLLAGLATSCMDSSDGALSTLDQLTRLNSVGFRFNDGWENALHPIARQAAKAAGLPAWLFLAGQHGEFELLFAISPEIEDQLNETAKTINWNPIPLGVVTESPRIEIPLFGEIVELDAARIRNLAAKIDNDPYRYINRLLLMGDEIRKGAKNHASY